jgi:hypothetical protein
MTFAIITHAQIQRATEICGSYGGALDTNIEVELRH